LNREVLAQKMLNEMNIILKFIELVICSDDMGYNMEDVGNYFNFGGA